MRARRKQPGALLPWTKHERQKTNQGLRRGSDCKRDRRKVDVAEDTQDVAMPASSDDL